MVCSSWGQRRQRVELWVTWGSQGWAWTPCPLLRALPSPSDKEETEVIHRRQAMVWRPWSWPPGEGEGSWRPAAQESHRFVLVMGSSWRPKWPQGFQNGPWPADCSPGQEDSEPVAKQEMQLGPWTALSTEKKATGTHNRRGRILLAVTKWLLRDQHRQGWDKPSSLQAQAAGAGHTESKQQGRSQEQGQG